MRLSSFLLPLFSLLAGAAHAQIVVLDDSFESTTHPTGVRTVAAGSGSAFYGVRSTSGTTLFLGDDSAGGLSGQVLKVAPAETTVSSFPVVANFTPGYLNNVNDNITLTFDFRFTNIPSASNTSLFRFGLESSNGTTVTADNQVSISDNDQGYYAQVGFGAGATPTASNLFYQESGGTTSILSGGDRTVITANNAGTAINDQTKHSVTFSLTRSGANTIALSLSISDVGGATITSTGTVTGGTNPLRTYFDEVAISNGFAVTGATNLQFNIDNVKILATVPEPGSWILSALGGVSLLGLRRRRSAGAV